MPARASLPKADLLFGSRAPHPDRPAEDAVLGEKPEAQAPGREGSGSAGSQRPIVEPEAPRSSTQARQASQAARPRHEEKVTFYCTEADLTRLEAARLNLRANHGLSCDRGRIIRAALAEVLEDLEAGGERSALVRRLSAE